MNKELEGLIRAICTPLPDVVVKDGKRKPLKTYCDKIIYFIHQIPFLKSLESHYLSNGLRSVVVDQSDNQKYEIVIKPLYEFHEE